MRAEKVAHLDVVQGRPGSFSREKASGFTLLAAASVDCGLHVPLTVRPVRARGETHRCEAGVASGETSWIPTAPPCSL
jgi:hypothetical protein